MQPVFIRKNKAIQFTLEYYDIYRVRDYLSMYAGTADAFIKKHLEDWYKITLDFHAALEEEILQVIYTTDKNTQAIFFNDLELWLTDFRIVSVNKDYLSSIINKYNEERENLFSIDIENRVKKFMENPNFKLEHLEKYDVVISNNFFLNKKHFIPYTVTKINYKFYCIEDNAQLIDEFYLSQYLPIVDTVITNLRRIITKYIELYKNGEVGKRTGVSYEQKTIEFKEQNVLPIPKDGHRKIKVNLSVPQLAYLFRLLNEVKPDIFDIKTKTELFDFISNNFLTKGSQDKLSPKSISNQYNDPDRKIVDYWVNILKKMLESSRKIFS